MLLNELSQPLNSVKKLNEKLHKSYGRRVPSDIDIDRLKGLLESVNRDIENLVVEGFTPEHPEYSRRLVIKHAAENMLTQRKKIQEATLATGVLDSVCGKLISFVCDCINNGDDHEHAIHKAMDVYRSSKYRFPDGEVEGKLRDGVDDVFGISPSYNRNTLLDDADLMFKERNKFLGSRDAAIKAGEEEFEVDGEVFPVKEEDKISAEDDPCWDDPPHKMVGTKMKGGKEVPNCVPGVKGESVIYEDAPPDMEDWILDNKEEFKKRYGNRWEEVLYATAWKIHNQGNGDRK